MATGIKGKTAVFSGASDIEGIGFALASGLAQEGASIVIADIADGSNAAAELEKRGTQAAYVRCDVSQKEDVDALRRTVEQRFGGCDILVHCASPFPSSKVDDMDLAEWQLVTNVNLDGLFLLTNAFLPGMKDRRWGRVIPIGSGCFNAGIAGRSHYVAAKAGVIGFARSLAREVGEFGITANVLVPGLVRTAAVHRAIASAAVPRGDSFAVNREQQCIKQTLVPENLVGPLVFLASDEAAFVTGQQLLVDGGWQHG